MKKFIVIALACLMLGTKQSYAGMGTAQALTATTSGVIDYLDVGNQIVSERYKYIHNLIISLFTTAYYTIIDSNEQNQNMHEWDIDLITKLNIIWRTLVYSLINYYESSYIPDHRATMTEQQIKQYGKYIAYAATTAAMITYNSHFQKMIIDRFNSVKENLASSMPEWAASTLSVLNIIMRNFVWWYTIPIPLRLINAWWYKNLPRQQTYSGFIYDKTKSIWLACLLFSLMDFLYQNGIMSIKHTVSQLIPIGSASDWSLLRCQDGTICYFGTNLFGKSGPLGRYLMPLSKGARDVQDNIQLFVPALLRQSADAITQPQGQPFNELQYPLVTTHTTNPYCGEPNPYCVFT